MDFRGRKIQDKPETLEEKQEVISCVVLPVPLVRMNSLTQRCDALNEKTDQVEHFLLLFH